MKLLELSFYGWQGAIGTFFKVILWVAASGAVAALIGFFNSYQIDTTNLYQVSILGLVNATLASIWKLLKTISPTSIEV